MTTLQGGFDLGTTNFTTANVGLISHTEKCLVIGKGFIFIGKR